MKRTTMFIVIVLSIFLVCLYTITSTYSVIVGVVDKDGSLEIVDDVLIKNFLIDENGDYNQLYYDLKSELYASDEEANLLMNSNSLNELLRDVLKSVVDYRVNENLDAKYTDEKLYSLISKAVVEDKELSDDLKSRVINKVSKYRNDISNYIYNIDISFVGNNK